MATTRKTPAKRKPSSKKELYLVFDYDDQVVNISNTLNDALSALTRIAFNESNHADEYYIIKASQKIMVDCDKHIPPHKVIETYS